jgi:hypothetical protein
MRWVSPLAGLSLAMLAALACDDHATDPRTRPPSAVAIMAGDAQTGTVGARLPAPLSAIVRDAEGRPLAGVRVDWNVSTGGGTVEVLESITNEAGLSRTNWVLGTTAGAPLHVPISQPHSKLLPIP